MARSVSFGEYRMKFTGLLHLISPDCSRCHVVVLHSLVVQSNEPVASVAPSGEKSNEQLFEWALKDRVRGLPVSPCHALTYPSPSQLAINCPSRDNAMCPIVSLLPSNSFSRAPLLMSHTRSTPSDEDAAL